VPPIIFRPRDFYLIYNFTLDCAKYGKAPRRALCLSQVGSGLFFFGGVLALERAIPDVVPDLGPINDARPGTEEHLVVALFPLSVAAIAGVLWLKNATGLAC